jgi:serine/threonine protein kinase
VTTPKDRSVRVSRERDSAENDALKVAMSTSLVPWNPGEAVGNGEFTVERLLGVGGFGAVYLVRHRISLHGVMPGLFIDGTLAAKRIAVHSDSDRDSILRELQSWNDVPDHPHLLKYLFVRSERDEVILFTKFMEGGSLHALARVPNRPPIDDVLRFASESIAGVVALHDAGLLHLDLKPGNMLLDRAGRLRIADFGLTTEKEESADGPAQIARGASPRYAPPEQRLRGVGSVGSDLYSWGASVLELLIGAMLPLTQRTLSTAASAGQIPDALSDLLRECLDPDVRKRPGSAREVADRLRVKFPTSETATPKSPTSSRAHVGEGAGSRTMAWQRARRSLLLVRGIVDELRFEARTPMTAASKARVDDALRMLADITLVEDGSGQGHTAGGQLVRAIRMMESARSVLRDLLDVDAARIRKELAALCNDLETAYLEIGDRNAALHALAEAEAVLSDATGAAIDSACEALLWSARRRHCVLLSTWGRKREALDYLSAFRLPPVDTHRSLPDDVAKVVRLIESDRAEILLGIEGGASEALNAADSALARAELEGTSDPLGRADLLVQRGKALDQLRRGEEALAHFVEAAKLLDANSSELPNGSFLERASSALVAQAVTLAGLGRSGEAVPIIERAVEMRGRASEMSSDAEARHRYAFAQFTAGSIYRRLDRESEALRSYHAAATVWRELVFQRGRFELQPLLQRTETALLRDAFKRKNNPTPPKA